MAAPSPPIARCLRAITTITTDSGAARMPLTISVSIASARRIKSRGLSSAPANSSQRHYHKQARRAERRYVEQLAIDDVGGGTIVPRMLCIFSVWAVSIVAARVAPSLMTRP